MDEGKIPTWSINSAWTPFIRGEKSWEPLHFYHFVVSLVETLRLSSPDQYDMVVVTVIDAWSNDAYENQSLPNLIFCWHSTKKSRSLKSESERNLVLERYVCMFSTTDLEIRNAPFPEKVSSNRDLP